MSAEVKQATEKFGFWEAQRSCLKYSDGAYFSRRFIPPDFVILAINGGSCLLQTRIMSRMAETSISGWILITKDKRIRFNELEKAAVLQNRVREFYFSSGNYSGAEMAARLTSVPGAKCCPWRSCFTPCWTRASRIGLQL